MKALPLVSVIVPTFNRRTLLAECLESVFKQVYRPLEVVVVDDGSTDGTDNESASWMELGRGAGVSVIWIQQNNSGVSAARNRGMELCSGEYVIFQDSDDLLDPNRIKLQVKRLEETGADLCAGSIHRIKPDGSLVSRYTPLATSTDRLSSIEVKKMHWGTQMFMYRRSAIGIIRWDERLSCAEDIEFNFRIINQGVTICVAPEAVTLIREHSDEVKLKSRPGGEKDYWTVHGRMINYYRDKQMISHLALEQANLLRNVCATYNSGNREEARARFRSIQPLAPGVIAGGIGERLALRFGWCGLFCIFRRVNNWAGGLGG